MPATSISYTWSWLLFSATGHALCECHALMSREDKRTRLQEGRYCIGCVRRKHVTSEFCTSRYITCDAYQKRPVALHLDLLRSRIYAPVTSRPQSCKVESDGEHTNQCTFTMSVRTSERSGPSVLLQTTSAWASGQKRCSILVRLLLGTERERSFITCELSNSLRCHIIDSEASCVYAFGNVRSSSAYTCQRVNVALQSRFNSNTAVIEAIEGPELCNVSSLPSGKDLIDRHYERDGLSSRLSSRKDPHTLTRSTSC